MRIRRITAALTAFILALSCLCACGSVGDVPFLTTKSRTTTVVNTVKVTFPEGYTINQIAARLQEAGVCGAEEFIEECKKPCEGIDTANPDDRIYLLEGYVFPDTYEFYFDSSPDSVLKKFTDNYKSKITDEMKEKAEALGYSMDEMLTLASIIQKECDKDPAECSNVSSVFHNRLKSPSFPMLQSDVTTFYITRDMGELLAYDESRDMDAQNEEVKKYIGLYSTYYCKGLPAGPICNPGLKAINAALNPAQTEYYYFLTDASGETFYYASNLSEHRANGKKAGIF